MIVLGIIGAVIAFGLPRFRSQQNNLKTSARLLASLFREVRNEARIKRMTYRVVFRIGEKDAYWVESASGNILVPSKAKLEEIQHMDEKERPPNPFQKVTKLIKDEKELPSGIRFVSVETPSLPDPVTSGLAYIYFTPEGLTEKAIVQVTNGKDVTWSLILNPLTGHADTLEKAMALKDLRFD
jgi:general secretion pathway protein H